MQSATRDAGGIELPSDRAQAGSANLMGIVDYWGGDVYHDVYNDEGSTAMNDMVRKQVYIQRRQEEFLKAYSADRGVTEAEIVREALDAYQVYFGAVLGDRIRDRSAWKEEEEFIAELGITAGASQCRTWRRDELHER